MITVSVDISIAGLSDLQKRQVPYAMSRSLNDTAKIARLTLIRLMPGRFVLRTGQGWLSHGGPKGTGWFEVINSTKVNLVAIVQATYDFLYLQEFSGTKTSRTGGRLAIPLGKLRLKKIPPQLRPKFVLGGKGGDLGGVLRAASLGPRSRKKHFVQFGAGFILKSNGKEFIARRVQSASQAAGLAVSRPKHGTLDLMYVLTRRATIHSRLGMAATVKKVVEQEFGKAFQKRFSEALATAR